MEMLVFTKTLMRLKTLSLLLGIISLLALSSCAADGDLKLLYDDAKNHKVFKISAHASLEQAEVKLKDTLWITIQMPGSTLYDIVSEKSVSVGEAKYICQLELRNMVNVDDIVDATFVIEEGSVYVDQNSYSTTGKNGYGFTFGYPNHTNLKIGIVPNEFGIFAVWFNNFPNPYHGCKGNNCDQGRGYWYDVFYNKNRESQQFEKSDFVDYQFLFNGKKYIPLELDKTHFLEYCIYPESIFFFKVQ